MARMNGGVCMNEDCDNTAAYAVDKYGGLGVICNNHAEKFEPNGEYFSPGEDPRVDDPATIITETGWTEATADVTVHDDWKDNGEDAAKNSGEGDEQ